MISNYKKIEAEHYNNKTKKDSLIDLPDLLMRHSRLYFEKKCFHILNIKNRKIEILDYGCGTGEKSINLAQHNSVITGIDISEKSVEIARAREIENTKYIVMDCEKTDFENSKFDLVFDYGTFSSINIKKALPEIVRIMKRNGSLIAIETYGHNPLTNLKRKINVLIGKRTNWAAQHIMKKNDWLFVSHYFKSCEIKYFGAISYFFLPLVKIYPPKLRKKLLNRIYLIDEFISNIPLLQKFSFKTVVVLNNPIKKII